MAGKSSSERVTETGQELGGAVPWRQAERVMHAAEAKSLCGPDTSCVWLQVIGMQVWLIACASGVDREVRQQPILMYKVTNV